MEHIAHNNFDLIAKICDKQTVVLHGKKDSVVVYEVEAGGELTIIDLLVNGGRQISEIDVRLTGEGAKVNIFGLFFGTSGHRYSISHTVHHLAPHTNSKIQVRGVLNDNASAKYLGNIKIAKGFPGCLGHQEMRALLLSKESHIDATPDLDIGNNDVQCSHSVSISTIDKEKRFYLESRGMNDDEAKVMIIRGHLEPILENIEDEAAFSEIIDAIEKII